MTGCVIYHSQMISWACASMTPNKRPAIISPEGSQKSHATIFLEGLNFTSEPYTEKWETRIFRLLSVEDM